MNAPPEQVLSHQGLKTNQVTPTRIKKAGDSRHVGGMLKKLHLWWLGRPIPVAWTDEDGEIAGLMMPREGMAQRLRKPWRTLVAVASNPLVSATVGAILGSYVTHLARW
jgi:hypothetical protein